VAQDHNGFSHQDPGFIDLVVNKKADVIRVYLPPDANTLLSVTTTACADATTSTSSSPGKQPRPVAGHGRGDRHCTAGVGIWEWASNDQDADPDVVLACAGDVPTIETLAAADLLRATCPT
jgi:xylulose-5-phosphate/fructose-6-phosphate phosphoketolase